MPREFIDQVTIAPGASQLAPSSLRARSPARPPASPLSPYVRRIFIRRGISRSSRRVRSRHRKKSVGRSRPRGEGQGTQGRDAGGEGGEEEEGDRLNGVPMITCRRREWGVTG